MQALLPKYTLDMKKKYIYPFTLDFVMFSQKDRSPKGNQLQMFTIKEIILQ